VVPSGDEDTAVDAAERTDISPHITEAIINELRSQVWQQRKAAVEAVDQILTDAGMHLLLPTFDRTVPVAMYHGSCTRFAMRFVTSTPPLLTLVTFCR
jgi:hypothetical protein